MVEFEMNVQEAAEAANVNSYQMYSSFGTHSKEAGRIVVRDDTPPWVIKDLRSKGYNVVTRRLTSGRSMQFGSIIKMERCGEDHQTLVKIMELVGNFIYYLGFIFV